MALTYKQVILCLGMLIFGSMNTLSKKAQFQCSAFGFPDPHANHTSVDHKFNHPWFQTLIMFMGEITCLFGLAYSRFKERKTIYQEERNRLMVSPSQSGDLSERLAVTTRPRIFQWIIAIPTVFDLIGTSLAGIGLLYVDASMWQMFRGSLIIFTGLFSKIFLKRKIKNLQWLGMIVTVTGLVLVGLSGILGKGTSSGKEVLIGIIFILLGQLVNAAQMIIEETFLKSRNFEPLQVVGMEGTFGLIFMIGIVLPAMYFIPGHDVGDRYENALDALYQIGNNPLLLGFCIMYLISIAFYNYFGLAVTNSLTAVHRTLMDACRTIIVWIVNLSIYYIFTKDFGESFDKRYGIFQIDGFLFLMLGTAFYNELMDVPCIPALKKSQSETYPSLIDSGVNESEPSIQIENSIEEERTPLLPN